AGCRACSGCWRWRASSVRPPTDGAGSPERHPQGAAAREPALAGRTRHSGRVRYSDAVDEFVTHLAQVRRLSPSTVRAYRSDLADLQRAVHDIDLGEIDLEALRDWLWQATQRGDARATLARRAAAVRSFFGWAHDT